MLANYVGRILTEYRGDGLTVLHSCLGPQWGMLPKAGVPQIWGLGHLEAPSVPCLVSGLWWLEGCVPLDYWVENLHVASPCGFDVSQQDIMKREHSETEHSKWPRGSSTAFLWPLFRRHIASLLPHFISWSIQKPSRFKGKGLRP